MGEMADYFLEFIMTYDDLRSRWLSGHMTEEEAYDIGIIDEFGAMDPEDNGRFSSPDPQPVQCRYCNKSGYFWFQHETGYRLTKDGKTPHVCPMYRKG